ncbi:MAG: hypothetical protein IIC60_07080 [Proteobacteria bacterium]|nr:hypothetical protein [Pseudomonadota bacterium]
MTEIAKYLQILKQQKEFSSYFKIAKFLGVSASYIYEVKRTGKLSDKKCIIIADKLNLEPLEIIAARNCDNAKDMMSRAFWSKVHYKYKK